MQGANERHLGFGLRRTDRLASNCGGGLADYSRLANLYFSPPARLESGH